MHENVIMIVACRKPPGHGGYGIPEADGCTGLIPAGMEV